VTRVFRGAGAIVDGTAGTPIAQVAAASGAPAARPPLALAPRTSRVTTAPRSAPLARAT